jgi:hypothetical protein
MMHLIIAWEDRDGLIEWWCTSSLHASCIVLTQVYRFRLGDTYSLPRAATPAVVGMKVGSRRRILIPPQLGWVSDKVRSSSLPKTISWEGQIVITRGHPERIYLSLCGMKVQVLKLDLLPGNMSVALQMNWWKLKKVDENINSRNELSLFANSDRDLNVRSNSDRDSNVRSNNDHDSNVRSNSDHDLNVRSSYEIHT